MQVKNLGSFSWLKPLFFLLVLMGSFLIAPSQSQAAGIISGTVYNDVNDNLGFNTGIDYAVQGATVELQTNAGVAITTATTNAAGLYTFPAQAAGNYKIVVKTAPTGYATVATEVKTIIVTTTADNPNNHLAIKGTGGSIAGRVFDDQDRNIAFGGTDINKTNVRVFLKKDGTVISTVTTTSTGYIFQNLPNAAYTVEVSVEDLDSSGLALVSTSDGVVDTPKKEITLASVTSAIINKNFAATEINTSGVDGIAVIDMNGDNAYVPGEDVLLPGATVTLYYNDGTTVVPGFTPVVTDAVGKYQIKNIPLWKYKVKVTVPAGYISSGSKDGTAAIAKNTIALDLANASAPYALYNFYVEGDSTSPNVTGISGYVFGFDNNDHSGALGPDGGGNQNNIPTGSTPRFQNVTVQLYKGGVLQLTQKTKSDGSYAFKGLSAGTYTVKMSPAAIPSGYIFMNDSDGKSPTPYGGGPAAAPYEITRSLTIGTTQVQQNFWFGKEGSAFFRFPTWIGALNGATQWGGLINNVTSIGWAVDGVFRLYEEDGVTIAKRSDGSNEPDLTVSFRGSNPGNNVFQNRIPGVYILKPVNITLGSDVLPSNWDAARGGWVSKSHSGGGVLNTFFKGSRTISGQIYLDMDTTDGAGFKSGTDIGLQGARVIAVNLDKTYTGGYFGTYANGLYSFTDIPAGKYRITVDSLSGIYGGYGNQITYLDNYKGTGAVSSFDVDVTVSSVTGADLWFKTTNTEFEIKGTTWLDIYPDGVLVSNNSNYTGDSRLAGVKIELLNAAGNPVQNGGVDVVVTSDASGNYSIKGAYLLPNTTYKIRASKADVTVASALGGAVRTVGFGPVVAVNPVEDFLLQGPGRVTGIAFIDTAGNGLNSGIIRPDGNGTSYLDKWNGTAYVAMASRGWNASYNYGGLEPGQYRIRHGSGSFDVDPASPVGQIEVTIPAGGGPNSYVLASQNFIDIASGGGVSGAVYVDSNGNGEIDGEDILLPDIAGLKVYAFHNARFLTAYNTPAQITAAASSPNFTINVSSGTYTQSATGMGSMLFSIDEAALNAAGFTLVKNSTGIAPADTNTQLPAALKGINTIRANVLSSGIQNQNFLVKRSVPSQISGRVYYDIDYDNNFVLGTDSGITGQTIELYQGATKIASQQVDGTGAFRFENILDGTYTIKLLAGSIPADMVEAPMSTTFSRTVTISNATPTYGDINFWYNKSGEAGIAGQVLVDLNNNGNPDSTDYPLITTVTLKKGAAVVQTTTTNSRGNYKFTGIAQDNYTVELSVPAGYSVYKTSAGNTTIPSISVNMASSMMYTGRYFLLAGNSNANPGTGPGGSGAANSGITGFLYKGSSVTPPAGDRLANVSVSLYNSSDALMGTVLTDSTGKYQFFNLSAGTYKVNLDQTPSGLAVRGDVDTSTPLGVISVPVVANSGKTSQNIWFAEISPNGIKGKVTYSGAGSTTAGALDIPIPGLTVELYDAASLTTPVGTATTAADGSYEFLDIATMDYVVQVKTTDKTAKGYRDLNPATGKLTITNLPAAGVTGQNFILGGTYSFAGKIEKDTTGDRVVDASIPNVDTTLLWAGPNGIFGDADDVKFGSVAASGSNTVLAGKTDVNGQYIYVNLPNGKYKVGYTDTAAAFTGLALIPTTVIVGNTLQPRELTLASANITDAHFAYETLANLEGRIVFDANGNNLYDATDFGIAGIPLTIYRKNGVNYDLLPLTATTNATGNYIFTGVPYGEYRVVVNTTTLTTLSPVFDKDGTADSKIELAFTSTVAEQSNWHFGYNGAAGSSKSVTVKTRLDSNSNAAYDATDAGQPTTQVIVAGPFVNGTITTNSSGDYNFPKLPYGDYTFTTQTIAGLLSVYDNDGTPFNKITNLAINGSSADPAFGYRADITGGSFTISGNVLFDVNGNAAYDVTDWGLSGVKLSLEKKVGAIFAPVASFTAGTPTSGAYSFTGLTAGEYRVTVDPTTLSPGLIPAYGVDASHQKTKVISGSETNWYLGYTGDVPGGKARNVKVLTRYDSNFNNAYDVSDTNAAGVSILLTGNGFNQTIITDGSGEYTFNTLPYGTYTMTATTPTGLSVVYDFDGAPLGAVTFLVANNTQEPYFGYVVDFSGGNRTLSGEVVLDITNLGTKDLSDIRLAGVHLKLYKETSPGVFTLTSKTATTAANGSYSFTGLVGHPTLQYKVEIDTTSLPANLLVSFDKDGIGGIKDHNIIGLVNTTDVIDWDFGYKGDIAGGHAKNVIINTHFDSNNNSAYESTDAAQVNVSVTLTGTGISTPSVISTGATGSFTFVGLPLGTYTLTAATPSGMKVVYNSAGDITTGVTATVNAAYPGTPEYFGYQADAFGTFSLSGRVVLDTNDSGDYTATDIGINNAKLILEMETAPGIFTPVGTPFFTQITAGVSGSYTFSNIKAAKYRIKVDTTSAPILGLLPVFDKDGVATPHVITRTITGDESDWYFGYKGDTAGGKAANLTLQSRFDNGNSIYDASDVVEAPVTIQITGNGIDHTIATDSITGNFLLKNFPHGTYTITATTPANRVVVYNPNGTSSLPSASYVVTGTASTPSFGYRGTVTLDGYVTFDVDNNGQRTAADKVTVGATVQAVHTTLGTYTTTTDADGKYTFTGLTSGDWTISVDKAASALTDYTDRYAGTTPNVGSIVVTATGSGVVTPTNRDLGLLGQGIIEGNVVIDENGNGIYNTEDVRPVQARVEITKTGDPTFAMITTTTDMSGHFKVEHLTPGYAYNVEVLPPLGRAVTYVTPSFIHKGAVGAPGGSLATTHTRFVANLPTPTTIYSDYVAGFKSNLSLSGKVSLDVDASQTKTASDIGIAGMTVKLSYQDNSITPFTVTTDADGNYIANGIAPGIWKVEMDSTPPTGTTESYEGTRTTGFLGYQNITVVASPIANVDFGYYGTAKTSGIIKLDRNSNGTDDAPDLVLAGVTVTLKDPNSSNFTRQTTTDSAGAYSFEHISNWNSSGDDYVVSVNFATDPVLQPYALSYGAVSNILNLTDHSTNKTIATIGAKGSLTIEGYVHHDVNDDGLYEVAEIKTDFAARTIQLFDNSNNLIKTVQTDSNDHYVLEDVGPGTWKVVVLPADVTTLRTLGYKPSYDYDDLYTSGVVTANTTVVNMTSTNVNAVNFGYVWGGKIETVAKIASGATYNPADPGIPNAKITLQDQFGVDIETRLTDSSGKVIFRNLDPSVDYKLVAKYGINQLGETLAPVLFAYAGVYGVNDDPLTGIVTIDAPLSDITKALDNELTQTQAYFGFSLNNQEVTILKVARKDKATIGEFVPYIIEITNNNETDEVLDATIRDMIPAGFKYVTGSGRFTDVNKVVTKIEPVGTRPIEFKHINVPAGKKVRITYLLVVGAGVTPGEYVNKAQSINQFGFANSNISSATVKVVGDPLFDDSLIFGKVFHDKNRNGRQDKDEAGVQGVKLVTARGEIITTDEHGRYHLADVSGGRWERGTNFILKLDTRSLPQGLTTTTENPIVVRLSPGLPSRINFGVEVPPPIAARLAEQLTLEKSAEVKRIEEELKAVDKFVVESVHFAFDADRIEPEFENTLDSLAEVLKLHPEWRIAIEGHTDSIGSATYNKDLSQRRADAVKSYLLSVGVNPSQLATATGFGSEQPVADNSTAEGRHKNRRVEFLLVK